MTCSRAVYQFVFEKQQQLSLLCWRTVFSTSLMAVQTGNLFGESAACSMAATGTDLIELVVSFARHFEVCTLHPPTAWAFALTRARRLLTNASSKGPNPTGRPAGQPELVDVCA